MYDSELGISAIEGGRLSTTVTIASQKPILAIARSKLSNPNNLTGFAPRSSQSKSVVDCNKTIPQSSNEPLSSWEGLIVTSPLASNSTVISWQIIVGSVSSGSGHCANNVKEWAKITNSSNNFLVVYMLYLFIFQAFTLI